MLFHRQLLVASILNAVLALPRAADKDPNLFVVGRGLAVEGTCEEVFAEKKYDLSLFSAQDVYFKLRAEFPTSDQCTKKLLKSIDQVATTMVSDSTGIVSNYIYDKGSKEGMSAMGAEDDIKVCSSVEGSKLVIDAGVHVRLCYLTENQGKRNLAIADPDEDDEDLILPVLAEKKLNMSQLLEEKRLNVTIEKKLMDYQLEVARLKVQKAEETEALINKEGPFVSTDVLDAIYKEKEFQYKQKMEEVEVEADKERKELKVKQKHDRDNMKGNGKSLEKEKNKMEGDVVGDDQATTSTMFAIPTSDVEGDVEILAKFVNELYKTRLDRKIMSKSKFDQCMDPEGSISFNVLRVKTPGEAMPQC